MGSLLSYSLAASIFVMLLFPVLHLLVNRSTSFCFNRFTLLAGAILSFLLPLLLEKIMIPYVSTFAMPDIGMPSIGIIESTDSYDNEVPTTASLTDSKWIWVLFLCYFVGLSVFCISEIISYLRLISIIIRSKKTKSDKFIICKLTDSRIAPFSWGKYIFLHDLESIDDKDTIFLHEKAHTEKRHWVDVLLIDIYCILLWYNPFAWQTRRLMKQNHEFEADMFVIRSGIRTAEYQRQLITKAIGQKTISVVNSFSSDIHSFRKRVLIMGKPRSSRKTMLISFFAIPAVILSATIISSPVSASILNTISDYDLGNKAISVGSQCKSDENTAVLNLETVESLDESETLKIIPSPFEDQTALAEIIRLSLETVQIDKDTKVNIEIVVDEDGRVKDVSSDTQDGTQVAAAINKEFNGVRLEQITDNGRPIEVHFVVPVQLKKKE